MLSSHGGAYKSAKYRRAAIIGAVLILIAGPALTGCGGSESRSTGVRAPASYGAAEDSGSSVTQFKSKLDTSSRREDSLADAHNHVGFKSAVLSEDFVEGIWSKAGAAGPCVCVLFADNIAVQAVEFKQELAPTQEQFLVEAESVYGGSPTARTVDGRTYYIWLPTEPPLIANGEGGYTYAVGPIRREVTALAYDEKKRISYVISALDRGMSEKTLIARIPEIMMPNVP